MFGIDKDKIKAAFTQYEKDKANACPIDITSPSVVEYLQERIKALEDFIDNLNKAFS